ncbi:hypothetical protein Gohar_020938, partial [Gossypium harknessii]|nr:hypothetical protein [Gossypium harknessii]
MYKLAADDGMSLRLIVVYRFMFATVIMVPLALIFERKSLKKINRKVLLQAFLCGLFGIIGSKLVPAKLGAYICNICCGHDQPCSSLYFYFGHLFQFLLRVLVDSVTLLRGVDRQQEHPHPLRALDGETGNKNKCRESQSVWDITRNRWSN